MDLKDIASVSGKGGLYLVVKPTRTGVILETIDEAKSKFIANANSRVSLLKEISIYTSGKESSQPLEDVFKTIYEKFGKTINVSPKSSNEELHAFMKTVVPEYDNERVYTSDIKKLAGWYTILMSHFPDRFETKEEKPVVEKKEKIPKAEPKKKEEETVKAAAKTKTAKK